jgi:hypothetical protein
LENPKQVDLPAWRRKKFGTTFDRGKGENLCCLLSQILSTTGQTKHRLQTFKVHRTQSLSLPPSLHPSFSFSPPSLSLPTSLFLCHSLSISLAHKHAFLLKTLSLGCALFLSLSITHTFADRCLCSPSNNSQTEIFFSLFGDRERNLNNPLFLSSP